MSCYNSRLRKGSFMVFKKYTSIATMACVLCVVSAADASPLVFQGQNAGIFPGANPSDTAQMMLSVPKPTAATSAPSQLSSSQVIIQSLEAQISNKIYSEIFGTGAQPSGTQTLPDGSVITWNTVAGVLSVSVTYPNGTVVQLL